VGRQPREEGRAGGGRYSRRGMIGSTHSKSPALKEQLQVTRESMNARRAEEEESVNVTRAYGMVKRGQCMHKHAEYSARRCAGGVCGNKPAPAASVSGSQTVTARGKSVLRVGEA